MNEDTGAGQASTKRRYRRSAQTRATLIRATINCLHEHGYSNTSVELIMKETRFSRGAVLHQFPTRLDLIAAAIEVAMHETVDDIRNRFETISDPATAYRKACDFCWETCNTPQSAAISEALLASRRDKDLAAALFPIGRTVEAKIDELISGIATAAGAKDVNACLVQSRILIVSLRGMTLELAYSPNREIIHQTLDRIRRDHELHCDDMLIRTRQK